MRRPGSPLAHEPIVETQEVHSRTAFDEKHDAGLDAWGPTEITQQDRQPLQSGLRPVPATDTRTPDMEPVPGR